MASIVEVIGAAQLNPANPVTSTSASAPSFSASMNLGLRRSYAEHEDGGLKLSAAVDVPLPFGTVASAVFLALRVISGSFILRVTSAAGANQQIRCSDLWVWSAPTGGDEITGILLTGTGEIEYILAGA